MGQKADEQRGRRTGARRTASSKAATLRPPHLCMPNPHHLSPAAAQPPLRHPCGTTTRAPLRPLRRQRRSALLEVEIGERGVALLEGSRARHAHLVEPGREQASTHIRQDGSGCERAPPPSRSQRDKKKMDGLCACLRSRLWSEVLRARHLAREIAPLSLTLLRLAGGEGGKEAERACGQPRGGGCERAQPSAHTESSRPCPRCTLSRPYPPPCRAALA